jgi:hypothetical protein
MFNLITRRSDLTDLTEEKIKVPVGSIYIAVQHSITPICDLPIKPAPRHYGMHVMPACRAQPAAVLSLVETRQRHKQPPVSLVFEKYKTRASATVAAARTTVTLRRPHTVAHKGQSLYHRRAVNGTKRISSTHKPNKAYLTIVLP